MSTGVNVNRRRFDTRSQILNYCSVDGETGVKLVACVCPLVYRTPKTIWQINRTRTYVHS